MRIDDAFCLSILVFLRDKNVNTLHTQPFFSIKCYILVAIVRSFQLPLFMTLFAFASLAVLILSYQHDMGAGIDLSWILHNKASFVSSTL